ncbi:MAG TPA: S-methyl-5-thioribose-1-phosphate isomerase [Candidatus Eisenbacteria bacterium]|jgi:methylthioribose-1-phosphate isomerase
MEPFRLGAHSLHVLDQTRLPREEVWMPIGDAEAMRQAITALRVRGAPAIGIAAALALALEAERTAGEAGPRALAALERAAARLRTARPTAVNLAWAVDRVQAAARDAAASGDGRALAAAARAEALRLWEEDRAASRAMAEHGVAYFPRERRFLTHCNTGGLATGGGGTALGVLIEIHRRGRPVEVWVTETRPLLQGARLTAFELQREGVPTRLLVDGAAAFAICREGIEAVVTGADRVAGNGDVANKVGTLALALAARDSGIPFVVVAPSSTLDPECPSGEAIPIEQRGPGEVASLGGQPTAPEGVPAYNPAFDVTPARLVTAVITEHGVWEPARAPIRSR